MQLAIAGWPVAGYPEHSQLHRITDRLRLIGRWFIDTLNQRGNP